MEEEPEGARKGGGDASRRRQVIVAAVAGLCVIAAALVVPDRWVSRLSVLGMLMILAGLILTGIAVKFFPGRQKGDGC